MFTIIHRYAAFYAASDVQQSTAMQCEEKLDRIFRHLCQEHGVVMHDDHIEGLTPQVLTDYYVSLASAQLKMSTRNNYISFLNPFLFWAYQNEYLGRDLSKILKVHKLPSKQSIPENERVNKRLTPQQVNDLLSINKGHNVLRDRAIMALFLYSGLRVSELCSLTIGAVMEHPNGVIYLKRKGGNWCSTNVGMDVYPYLEAYLATRPDRDCLTAPLFITNRGTPCNRKQLHAVLSHKQKKLGVATGPHVFRHTFVSQVGETSNAAVARDLANHSSLAITNRYSHSTMEERRQAVDHLPWGK